MWMLLVCSTPPRSDLFDAPERSRLIVVGLFPKASRKAKGNSFEVEGLLGECGNRFFDLNGVQRLALLVSWAKQLMVAPALVAELFLTRRLAKDRMLPIVPHRALPPMAEPQGDSRGWQIDGLYMRSRLERRFARPRGSADVNQCQAW